MSEPSPEPTYLQKMLWPAIICLLLGGHTMFMLIAMTFALSGPPMDIPEEYGKPWVPQTAKEIVTPNPPSASNDQK